LLTVAADRPVLPLSSCLDSGPSKKSVDSSVDLFRLLRSRTVARLGRMSHHPFTGRASLTSGNLSVFIRILK
jgi:hypothetical protein